MTSISHLLAEDTPELDSFVISFARAVTIRKSAASLYELWRHPTRLAAAIKYPAVIEELSNVESTWTIDGPLHELSWKAVITEERPDSFLAWRSTDDSAIEHAGYVSFNPAPVLEETEVIVGLGYNPPGGKFGNFVAKLTRESGDSHLYDTLRRLKALLEAGEIPTIDGQPRGNQEEHQ